MVKARIENSNCAMCCNPNPTQVYKHLPGFVKLLCSLSESLASSAGLKALIGDETGSGALVFATSPTLVTPILGEATATGVTLNKVNVTQTTSATTAVTANGYAGVITTVSQTLAAAGSLVFTLNNNKITTSSVVQVTLNASALSAGIPIVSVGNPSNGSVQIFITNVGVAALNNILKINYTVF